MTKGKELTDAQKGAILALVPLYSHAKIGARLRIPRATITKFIKRVRERESIENLPYLADRENSPMLPCDTLYVTQNLILVYHSKS